MNKIEEVELYSIGGLCEQDLTGSGHFLIIKYQDKTKEILQLEAGFWQKKETQYRNALFPEIIVETAPGCIILSHGHLDHAGRLVPMHKALLDTHGLKGIPIIMSEASRQLLPHILRAIHRINEDTMRSFDQEVSQFAAKWSGFEREYARKPAKSEKNRGDHRPEGEKRAERKRDTEKEIDVLKSSFEDWGGYIDTKTGIMKIPGNVGKGNVGRLNKILREIERLRQPENSGVLSTREAQYFQGLKDALARLFLEGKVFEQIDEIFAEDIPRHKRKERTKRLEEAKKILDTAIDEKRKTLLPDIEEADIGKCVSDASGMSLEKEFEVPGIPHVRGTFHHAGHVLGSVSVELIFEMTNNRTKRLLFSGDVGSFNKPTLHGMPVLPQNSVDRLIMESTYAGKRHIDAGKEIEKIVDFIGKHKGPILMPVFAFDRLFVVLHALQEKIISGKIKCPIYCRNRLGDATKAIYEQYYPHLREVFSYITFLSGKEGGSEIYSIMESDEHCIILASGGTLIESSSAHGLLQHRATTGRAIYMILTGYQPGELGAKIMHFIQDAGSPEKIEILVGTCETELNKNNIVLTGGFSGHADDDDLERLGQVGDTIYLIHGDPKNAPILANKIGAEILPREEYIKIF